MPSITRIFNGRMNKDVHPFRMKPGDYADAVNITRDSPGEASDGPPSNIQGNDLVSYAGIGTGTFKTIGKYEDKLRNRIYAFTWFANGKDSITYFDKSTSTIVKVMEDLTDTGGVQILNFNPSWKINHVDVIYRDEGDLLCWTDGLNNPSKINVATALSGGYGVIQRSYLDVAKEPPAIPPAVTYEDDPSVTVNGLRKKLLKFKLVNVFDDLETSVSSAQSELPLPINFMDTAVDKDPQKNARIALVIPTGKPNVKKLRILAAQSLGNVFSDFFLVKEIDKVADGIPNDDLTIYKFFNDEAYNYVDITESILDADWVPKKAYTQSLPNGDVLTYAAVTEGFNRITADATVTSTYERERTTQLPILFVANQSGDSGLGAGNIHIVCIGTPTVNFVFTVKTTNDTLSFTGATTNNDVMIGLRGVATGLGYTIISQDIENLIIVKANESLQYVKIDNTILDVTDSYVYDYSSRGAFGLLYRDQKGRQIGGVITNKNLSFQTINYTESGGIPQIPLLNLVINHRPPIEAYYYHWVRTKNLTKSKWIYWVCERTFKDSDFAYIGIESLTTFITNNPTTILSYEFIPGDRIRFIKQLSNGLDTIYTTQDFDMQSVVENPQINGTIETGRFVKIVLPATSGTFDFGVVSTVNFNNYLIQLYTPALSVANGLNAYYEFGERFTIGNPGLSTRYHQGQLQNQTSSLSQPATFSFDKGDAYYRHRTINTGVEIVYGITAGQGGDVNAGRITLGCTPTSVSYNDPNIIVGTSPYTSLAGFNLATNTDRAIIKIGTGTFTFRIKGSIIITWDADRTSDQYEFALQKNDGTSYNLVPAFDNSKAGTYSFNIDTTFTMTSGQRLFIFGLSIPDYDHTRSFMATNLTITRQLSFTVPVTDLNFSDFFSSQVNSNGRSSIVDQNSKETYFPVTQRFGGEYQSGTNINQINRFYFENQDTYDRGNGDIMKLFIEGRYQYVFHKYDVGVVPILTQIVKDVSGNPLEANSDILLNKITYPYKGKFGIGDCPESFAFGKNAKYFFDNNKGVVCRLSQDGIIALSVLYEMNSFFVPKGPSFRKELNNGVVPTGQVYKGNPAVYGVFDSFTNKYIIALERIDRYHFSTDSNPYFHQDPFTLAFLETRNESEGFESQYTYYPEMMACLDNLLVTWSGGKTYRHDSDNYCNFYGVQYPASITAIFNDHMRQKKTWQNISITSNIVWICDSITTELISHNNIYQQSTLLGDEFKRLEGEYNASFKQDTESPGGKINGSPLKGKYIIIRVTLPLGESGDPVFLNDVSVQYIDSPYNERK